MASSARKTSSKSEAPTQSDNLHGSVFSHYVGIASAVATVVSVLLAAPPAYWSYLCRSEGRFCEGSVISPTISSAGDDRVNAKLSTENGADIFEGLFVKERGSWLFGKRLDVVAKFKDGTDIPIDTLTSDAKDVVIYNGKSRDVSVVVLPGANSQTSKLTAYFSGQPLLRREYELSIPTFSKKIEIRNIDYLKDRNLLVFDVSSSWTEIIFNSQFELNIDHKGRSPFETPKNRMFGDTVFVELSETKHIKSVTSQNSLNYAKKLKSDYDDYKTEYAKCLEDVNKSFAENASTYEFCTRQDRPEDSSRTTTLFLNKGGKPVEAAQSDDSCVFQKRFISKDRTAMLKFCPRRDTAGHAYISGILNIGAQSDDDKIWLWLSLTGDCSSLDVDNLEHVHGSNALTFELITNCSVVNVNDTPFKLPPVDNIEQITHRMYSLTFDEHKIVRKLTLLEKTGQ